ncbi:uncharacterized protein [Temnothorax nylanderi]|uniref:uncharacterized protein n=1 Tax=Temnothorax nylanderi TaxID=102681 RepID=UPI003A8C42D9
MMKQPRELELYPQVLTELEKVLSEDNIDRLKELSNLIDNISNAEDQITLRNYYDNASSNPVRSTNLIILACKHNKVKILEYLFDSDSRILNNMSVVIGRNTILPDDEDETCHNAFYYAIRSCNVELLDTLISKWPDNYFADNLGKLDEILSRAYEELKLKDVPLSDEMERFVQNKLIDLRFFSTTSRQDQNVKSCLDDDNIRERIELTLRNINMLKEDYSNTEKVDKRFLFVAIFIAKNIHILKRQLKSTYDRLPWEEMEFCLVSFVSSHTKQKEINLFSNATLNKNKILNHLENFAKKLKTKVEKEELKEEKHKDEKKNLKKKNIKMKKKNIKMKKKNLENFAKKLKDEKESVNINKLPNLTREEVVAEIISSDPQFQELYNDYEQIRDIYSLMKISDYIKLALSADSKEREGQLIIIRVLQVIGEHLKNTLESPKLSNTTSELLLLSLPKNTRKVIIDLRNSLSHAHSLSKRIEIEKNTDVSFFAGVQNDIKKIDIVITDILYSKKIKTLKMLLKRIVDSESLGEIKEIAKIFSNAELDKMISADFKMMEYEKLEKLIKELSDNITDKTDYEKKLFNKINDIINCAGTQSENIRTDYLTGHNLIKGLINLSEKFKIENNVISGIKFIANRILENMTIKTKPNSLIKIAELFTDIHCSIEPRIRYDNLDKLIYEIFFYILEFEISDIKWIKKFREKLNKKDSFTSIPGKTYNITKEEYNNQLALKLSEKLSELKNILSHNALSGRLIEKLPLYNSDKKLQAVVEMLVLDIMSILDSLKHNLIKQNNLLFLDANTPLLIGKCLRNHLAHDNALVNVLLFNPSIGVILNAKKLTEKNIIRNKKKIGKLVSDDSCRLRKKYDQDLDIITNQEKMIAALEEGNLESLKDCLKKGADINARNVNSWTTLHFAAKGSSPEIIKFILDQNLSVNVKDINGQSPLHIAAEHGRNNIVEFFIKKGLYIDDLDNSGKMPLHVAAQNGHENTVVVLLNNNEAHIIARDKIGLSPLHYAIMNNHIGVTKILLEKTENAYKMLNEIIGNLTPLLAAAQRGYLELVKVLLTNKANVNVINEDTTPLHLAALYGHLEVVCALIQKGAHVDASGINFSTPLHCAAENGSEKIVKILLKHGANVNAVNKINNYTPLINAAIFGHEKIVKTLLENNANASIATVTSMTPLHLAALYGHRGIVVALLNNDGVDIDAKAQNNATPLHCSVEGGHKEISELLIQKGAEINAKTNNNVTPLHTAALEGHKNIIDLLIDKEAKVNVKADNDTTPLHQAALKGYINIIDVLIDNEAEVDAITDDGITPLHIAAVEGHKDIVDLLIKKGAKVDAIAKNGFTPLHLPVFNGHKDIVNLLIESKKTKVDAITNDGSTPLHLAVLNGHIDIVDLLIKNQAKVNATAKDDSTPLHIAVEVGHKEIVEILIANRANVNVRNKNNITPLLSAIKYNHKEIVKVLISNGVEVNEEGIELLSPAVFAGYTDIVEILLEHIVDVNTKESENVAPLHLAATKGHKDIVNALITKIVDVDATFNNFTPLCFAAQGGYQEIVEILIARGANFNFKSYENLTPLHIAATHGHGNVVKVLLNKEANINVKNHVNMTPLELAVAHGHLEVVKMLLLQDYEKIDINAKGNGDWTILHYALVQKNNLEMVKYLVDNKGSNVNAIDAFGSKPIHIAAKEGCKDTVEFFLSKELSRINELDAANKTLLHYAAENDQLEVAKYLIAQGADVNAEDVNGLTPMHIAANFGYKDFIKVLLKNGAVYNAVDNSDEKPLEYSNDNDIINLLTLTGKLFEAVKRNDSSKVENYIKAGAVVNARDADGFTPLHYAAKFRCLEIVKLLLSNGAVYNAVSDGKTDFTVDENITRLFQLLRDSFENIKNNDSRVTRVINDLNKIKDIDTVKAIMNARNEEHKTLVVAAVHNNFSEVEQLKEVSQDDVSNQINEGLKRFYRGNYQRALNFFKRAYKKRKEILGSDNPGTLDIQTYIGNVSYAQGAYQEALNTFEEIFQKQKEILGLNDKNTLSTRSEIGLVLCTLGRKEEAFNIYQEVYSKQKKILGLNHLDTLKTYFHMAMVLEEQGKHEEAFNINRTVFEKSKKELNADDPTVLCIQENIAVVLANQGELEEALTIYKDVYERKKVVLSINHCSTLTALHNIGLIFYKQNNYYEALKAFQEVVDKRKKVLGENHRETLNTQYCIANVLFAEFKLIAALRTYTECFEQINAAFGSSHPTVLDILNKVKNINCIVKFIGYEPRDILLYLQKDITTFNVINKNNETLKCSSPMKTAITTAIIAQDKEQDDDCTYIGTSYKRDITEEDKARRIINLDEVIIPISIVRQNVLFGNELTDESIDEFLRIVRQSTSFETQSVHYQGLPNIDASKSDKSLQIIGGKNQCSAEGIEHWRCIFCDGTKLFVYDSIPGCTYDRLVLKEREYIKRRYPKIRQSDIIFEKVDAQPDGTSCGIYAAAFATTIVNKGNPCNVKYSYEVENMRQHFIKIIEEEHLSLFPTRP